MTRILDEFIQAVKQQQREGTTPPQSGGAGGASLLTGQDMALDPALTGVQGGDLRRVSFLNESE